VTHSRHQIRAFTLLELMVTIAVAMVIIAVLGKLLLDGIYLQRIAWERANRLAISGALTDRLHADALGAVAQVCEADDPTLTLKLLTYADSTSQHVQWVFRPDEVLRRVDGREAESFRAERLRFSAHVEEGARADLLVLDLIVSPPARSWRRPPRTSTEHVLLPRQTNAPVDAESERQP
jgi:type II secretory pathway pseudopilin PulG